MVYLFVQVLEAKDLLARDKNGISPNSFELSPKGFSDPFGVVTLGWSRQRTKVIQKSLSPVWNETLKLKINSLMPCPKALRIALYDKDIIGRQFLGNVEIPLRDLCKVDGKPIKFDDAEFFWYPLESGNRRIKVTGEIKLKIGWTEDSLPFKLQQEDSQVVAQPIITKETAEFDSLAFLHATGQTTSANEIVTSMEQLNINEDGEKSIFGNHLGILTVEIISASSLPKLAGLVPSRFDMDPFVVASLGSKSFKTRFKRHTINPTWEELMFFDISEENRFYVLKLSVYDNDKFSSNDYVGYVEVPIGDIVKHFEADENQEKVVNDFIDFEFELKLKKEAPEKAKLKVKFNFRHYHQLRCAFYEAQLEKFVSQGNQLSLSEMKTMLESLEIFNCDELLQIIFHEDYVDMKRALREFDAFLCSKGMSACKFECDLPKCLFCGTLFGDKKRYFSALDKLTHMAICTSAAGDEKIDSFLFGGYLTENYAQRKFLGKVASYISFGSYAIGKDNGNILVFDRSTGAIIEEKIPTYIRLGIRLLYQSKLSKNVVERKTIRTMLKNMTLRQGKKFDDPGSLKQIRPFVKFHGISLQEIKWNISPVEYFNCLHEDEEFDYTDLSFLTVDFLSKNFLNFNEFFYRELNPSARHLDSPQDPSVLVSPADCRMNAFTDITIAQKLWIKGSEFSLENLFGSKDIAKYYEGGCIGVFRLAPQDYHRFHHPVDGLVGDTISFEGQYYTVSPMAIRESFLSVYTENTRKITFIDSDLFGKVAYVAIGAMMVGSIVITSRKGQRVRRFDEHGYFAFGGSTVLIILPSSNKMRGRFSWDSDLLQHSQQQTETLVKVGSHVGKVCF